nr:immunoglobulin heavy chain junction region [Mus musculus]MBK4185969.1 immunoglobulin heavy chain junction region [Mus musculus]
CARSYFAFW